MTCAACDIHTNDAACMQGHTGLYCNNGLTLCKKSFRSVPALGFLEPSRTRSRTHTHTQSRKHTHTPYTQTHILILALTNTRGFRDALQEMSMGLEVDIKTAGNRAVIAKALGLTGTVGGGSDDTSKGCWDLGE